MALCLISEKKFERSLQMLEMVLKIDKNNEKALLRACASYIELVQYDKAEKVLKKLDEVAF